VQGVYTDILYVYNTIVYICRRSQKVYYDVTDTWGPTAGLNRIYCGVALAGTISRRLNRTVSNSPKTRR